MDGIEILRTFVAVADSGSLAGAARELGVAASVVTKRINQLEWRVRSRLFTRTSRHVALSEFGSRFLPSVRRVVREYDEVFDAMGSELAQIEGRLRIKVPTPMAAAFMAQLLAKYQRHFPLVCLDVVLADRAVDPSKEGFDLAIGALPLSFAGVIDEPICPLRRLVCAAPSYLELHGAPTHPRELGGHDCLVFQPAGSVWSFDGPEGMVSVDLHPRLVSNDMLFLAAAAIEGNGIALLPTYAAAAPLRAGTLTQVLDSFSVPTVWIKALVPERRVQTRVVQSLMSFLRAHLSPVPPWDTEVSTHSQQG